MTGIQLIANERARQIMLYDEEHDSGHTDQSLLKAATLINLDVLGSLDALMPADKIKDIPPEDLSWEDEFVLRNRDKYQGEDVRRLVISGALIGAEIDRLLAEYGDTELEQTDCFGETVVLEK